MLKYIKILLNKLYRETKNKLNTISFD